MGLYCERQHERDLIQSLLSAGSLIGLVFMNFLSDLRGRRLALIIDLAIAVASSLCTYEIYFSNNYRSIRAIDSNFSDFFDHGWI